MSERTNAATAVPSASAAPHPDVLAPSTAARSIKPNARRNRRHRAEPAVRLGALLSRNRHYATNGRIKVLTETITQMTAGRDIVQYAHVTRGNIQS